MDDDPRQWISFEDPDEQRTWLFDATFLRSNYRCIWGEGCQGILDAPAAELEEGCCSYGAHFVDDDDVATVVRAFVRLTPDHDAVPPGGRRGRVSRSGVRRRLRGGARVGQPPRRRRVHLPQPPRVCRWRGCALHIGALAAGERPLDWKPNVCWQLPLRLEHATDENGHVISRLRDWKRRDWGEGGKEFAWWCTEAPEAFVGDRPVYLSRRATRSSNSWASGSTTEWWICSMSPSGCRSPTRQFVSLLGRPDRCRRHQT